MLLKNLCLNQFSPNFRILSGTWLGDKTFQLGAIIVPVPQLAAAVLALAVVGLIYLMIRSTRFGWAMQATAMDRDAAELMGINTERIYVLVFGIGGATVGIAGGIMPTYLAVHPEVGSMFGLIAFVCVAMGGFGSIPGALLAAAPHRGRGGARRLLHRPGIQIRGRVRTLSRGRVPAAQGHFRMVTPMHHELRCNEKTWSGSPWWRCWPCCRPCPRWRPTPSACTC